MEKCLIFQKTIKAIKFSKTSLEVIVNIKDTSDQNLSRRTVGSLATIGAGGCAGDGAAAVAGR